VPEIFVSYRRTDSVGTAGRLFDRLAERFGADQVFRDIDSIGAGENFEESIRGALRLAVVVLIIIGPRWLEARRKDGTRRIDDPADYVRREIEIALSSGVAVIPLLVEGAALPAPESLPVSVRALALRNDFELSDRHWDSATRDLIRYLEEELRIPAREPTSTSQRAEGASQPQSPGRAAVAAFTGFLPNLLSVLTQPRHFLARYTQGRAPDLLAAVIFFVLALVLSDIFMTAVYSSRESVVSFYIGMVVAVVLVTVAISAPLWLAWRLVGATRHYARLIVVLLHQVAIAHLMVYVVAAIMFAGLELHSLNSFKLALDETMKQPSASAAFKVFADRLPPLLQGREVLFASGLAMLVTLAGAVWAIRSWGAYRDALGLSRRRSIGAILLWVLACWAVFALFAWLSSPAPALVMFDPRAPSRRS
jgi:hypothetical protein